MLLWEETGGGKVMTPQEFLEGLVFCAMDFNSRFLPVQEVVKIEGGVKNPAQTRMLSL